MSSMRRFLIAPALARLIRKERSGDRVTEGYFPSQLLVGGRDISLDRFVTPGPLDILSVECASDEEASAFAAPAWFGPEVTEEPAFQNRSIALEGDPKVPQVALSNAALDSLLDALENRIRTAQGYEAVSRERQIARPSKSPPVANGTLGPRATGAGDEMVGDLARALRSGR